jgi:hypothetical protein
MRRTPKKPFIQYELPLKSLEQVHGGRRKPPIYSTDALGEEGGVTTLALGEEGGGCRRFTTLAVGEEGGETF